MISKFCSALIVASTLYVLSGTAQANEWDTIGAGCVPDSDSIQNARYSTGGHGVSFASGQTGTIRLICGLNSLYGGGTLHSFDIYYTDPDGGTATYSISVNFKKANVGSTTSSSICSVVSSNTGTSSNNCNFTDFTPSSTVWYWYEVQIYRSSSSSNPEFLGVRTN